MKYTTLVVKWPPIYTRIWLFYCVRAYQPSVRTYAAIRPKRTLYNRSPSESPRHFAGRRDESVIVGYYTSAEVPFPRRKQPGCAFVRAFYAANPHRPQAMWAGILRGAAPLAHNFATKSSVLHLSRGVHVPEMQKVPYPIPWRCGHGTWCFLGLAGYS